MAFMEEAEKDTLVLTVPKHIADLRESVDEAVSPMLTERFGWPGYQVIAPGDDSDLYARAIGFVGREKRDKDIEVIDAEAALLRLSDKADADGDEGDGSEVYVRVVRLFPAGMLMSQTGIA